MRSRRKILVVSIAFLFSNPAFGLSADINSLPIFWGITNNNPTYHDACFKAQEAFFVQSGVTSTYNKLNNYVSGKATNTVNTFIDKNMPFTSKTAAVVVGTVYTVGIKKQITANFRNPLWTRMSHSIFVSQDTVKLGISIPF